LKTSRQVCRKLGRLISAQTHVLLLTLLM